MAKSHIQQGKSKCKILLEKCFVKCQDCGCLIEKGDEHRVKVADYCMIPNNDYEIIYCKRCKPPYDKKTYGYITTYYYKTGTFECDKEGKLIK